MPVVYIKDACAYSAMVLKKIDELDIEQLIEVKNISDPAIKEELTARDATLTVPCLFDAATDTLVCESGAVCAYLDEQYGNVAEVETKDPLLEY